MTPATPRRSLRHVGIFSGLDDRDRALIEQRCTWREFATHERIITQGDTSSDVFFVISGKIRVILYSAAGRTVALGDIGPGEMFGEYSAIDHAPRSATNEAIQPTLVATMTAKVFEEIIANHPSVAQRLIRFLVEEARALTARVFEFSTLAVANRIHAELLRLAQAAPGPAARLLIDPAPTHAEIASRISTHREAVTRELNRLAQNGLIERQGNALLITDLELLQRMVDEARSD